MNKIKRQKLSNNDNLPQSLVLRQGPALTKTSPALVTLVMCQYGHVLAKCILALGLRPLRSNKYLGYQPRQGQTAVKDKYRASISLREEFPKMAAAPIAVVTGAGGFVATELVKQLLEKGYNVRGSVRSLSNADKVQHLIKLGSALPGKLELREADLLKVMI